MGKDELGGMGDEGWGWGFEVSKFKNKPLSSSAAVEIFFCRAKHFFVDDDIGLSAIGSVRKRAEFL